MCVIYTFSMEEVFPSITPMAENPKEKIDLLIKQIFINSVQNALNKI